VSRDDELRAEFERVNPGAEPPDVIIDFERIFCRVHGEPFRAEWPKGYDIAYRMLFGEAVKTAEMLIATGGDKLKLGAELDRKPACCRVPHKALRAAYITAGVGFKAKCKRCGKFAEGSRFMSGEQVVYDHLCFGCIIRSRSGLS
jgi:hypothetical protein